MQNPSPITFYFYRLSYSNENILIWMTLFQLTGLCFYKLWPFWEGGDWPRFYQRTTIVRLAQEHEKYSFSNINLFHARILGGWTSPTCETIIHHLFTSSSIPELTGDESKESNDELFMWTLSYSHFIQYLQNHHKKNKTRNDHLRCPHQPGVKKIN